MSSHRLKQVNELIQQELGKIMVKETGLPPGQLVTITKVKTSPDLGQARIFVSIMPTNKQASILAKINKIRNTLQHELGSILVIRKIPKISFSIDIDQQKISHIDELIDKIHQE